MPGPQHCGKGLVTLLLIRSDARKWADPPTLCKGHGGGVLILPGRFQRITHIFDFNSGRRKGVLHPARAIAAPGHALRFHIGISPVIDKMIGNHGRNNGFNRESFWGF